MRQAVTLSRLALASAVGCYDPLDANHRPGSNGTGGATSGGGTANGGAPISGGVQNLGGFPEYCDCPPDDIACFCESYACPSLRDVPTEYKVTECAGGVTLYDSWDGNLYPEFMYFRDGALIGYSKRFPASPCGGEIIGTGETVCRTVDLCGGSLVGTGAGGCNLVQ